MIHFVTNSYGCGKLMIRLACCTPFAREGSMYDIWNTFLVSVPLLRSLHLEVAPVRRKTTTYTVPIDGGFLQSASSVVLSEAWHVLKR